MLAVRGQTATLSDRSQSSLLDYIILINNYRTKSGLKV